MRYFTILPILCSLQAVTAVILNRQFPHLIVPINANAPDTPQGTKFEADIEQIMYTEILFDVPINDASSCNLDFTMYVGANGQAGAPWYRWGADPFRFNITSLSGIVNKDTDTWNNRPFPTTYVGTVEVFSNGIVNVIGGSVPCRKGEPQSFLLHPASNVDGGIKWFELTAPLHGITYVMNA